ncbi:MAG TPA: hypothetical protein DCE18_04200 [Syntrophobacteraceae bacterium]|nr:hypothetical protein [Syntrophobacteraceae bacterium]
MSHHRILAADLAFLEELIEVRRGDFSALYLAVRELHDLIRLRPDLAGLQTVSLLCRMLQSGEHARQKQSSVLYREVANALRCLVLSSETVAPVAEQSLMSLTNALAHPVANTRRAAAEALGGMPMAIHGPNLPQWSFKEPPLLRWHHLLARGEVSANSEPAIWGRSLVISRMTWNDLLVVKLARIQDHPEAMCREAWWFDYLRSSSCDLPVRFDVPRPLRIANQYLFRILDPPIDGDTANSLHPQGYAIAFTAHRDYFRYINESAQETGLRHTDFDEALCRNAWLLGHLTAKGIVHTAPIPLFHNRVQGHRRTDFGLYEWIRGGRLDRWLRSCRYPNLGLTGPRDFEHLLACQNSGSGMYQRIGTQLLSLLLVAGSYFRNQDLQRVGLDDQGKPVDARDLFDRTFLQRLAQGIVTSYYAGFTGAEYTGTLPFDFEALSGRMIVEMGVDRHMEEILRVADQETMTDAEFQEFLGERGYSPEQAEGLERGAGDLMIHTGPHLGAFNNRISLPELIDLVAIASALCVAGRYRQERTSSPF